MRAPAGEGIGRRVMDENSRRSISPLLVFAIITALFAAGAAYFAHRAVRDAFLSRYAERDASRLQDFKAGIRGRVDFLLGRIQGAELLMAAVPGVAEREGKALSFLLGGESRASFAASVLLDERGGILDSRRVGSMPPLGAEEKGLWAGARRSLLSVSERAREAKPPRRKFDVQSSTLNSMPVMLVLAPSPSTKGFWGVVVSAKSLLPLREGEPAPGESVFLLAEPEQKVLFARRGEKFLSESIDGAFKRELAPALDIAVCCDPDAFNAANADKRSMAQSIFHLGLRRLRLVYLAERSGLGTGLTMTAGLMLAFWLASLALFYFLKPGQGKEGETLRTRGAGSGQKVSGRLASDQLATISRVSESVAAGAPFRDVILTVVGEVSRFFPTERYYAALYDEAAGRFLEVCSSRLGGDYRRAIASSDSGLPERIALREKEIVEVTSTDEWYGAPEALKAEEVGGAVVFPLVALGKVVGLAAFYFDAPREIDDNEVDYCAVLFHQAAAAISRALAASAHAAAPRTSPADSTEGAGEDEDEA